MFPQLVRTFRTARKKPRFSLSSHEHTEPLPAIVAVWRSIGVKDKERCLPSVEAVD